MVIEKDKQSNAIVITGPSGVGKSTIVREVVERTGAKFSCSVTTRQPRDGEKDYREYHFINRSTFEQMVQYGEMLEWAEVYGELYGTAAYPVREAIDKDQCIVLEIDVQGGLQVYERLPGATFIFILPPSDEELARRLKNRGTEEEESLRKRLSEANKEVQAAKESGIYKHFVVNDDLETAIRDVVHIVNQETSKR